MERIQLWYNLCSSTVLHFNHLLTFRIATYTKIIFYSNIFYSKMVIVPLFIGSRDPFWNCNEIWSNIRPIWYGFIPYGPFNMGQYHMVRYEPYGTLWTVRMIRAHTLWFIPYGPYHIIWSIWFISYDPYHMSHTLWSIGLYHSYDPYHIGHNVFRLFFILNECPIVLVTWGAWWGRMNLLSLNLLNHCNIKLKNSSIYQILIAVI